MTRWTRRLETMGLVAAFVVLSACWRGDVPPPAPTPVKPAGSVELATWHGPCRGGWGEVEIEQLSIADHEQTVVVRGVLAFSDRRARATLRGRRGAPLVGSMTEIEGLGTKWKLELYLSPDSEGGARRVDLDPAKATVFDGRGAHGRFVEVTYSGHHADLCTFDLRR